MYSPIPFQAIPVRAFCPPVLKTGARESIRLHRRPNSGTPVWENGIIGPCFEGRFFRASLKKTSREKNLQRFFDGIPKNRG